MSVDTVRMIIYIFVPAYFLFRGVSEFLTIKMKCEKVEAVMVKGDRHGQWGFIQGQRILPDLSYTYHGEKKTYTSQLKTDKKPGSKFDLYLDQEGNVYELRRAKVNLYTGIVFALAFLALGIYF